MSIVSPVQSETFGWPFYRHILIYHRSNNIGVYCMLSNMCWLFWQNIMQKMLFHYSYNNRKKTYCQGLLLNCVISRLLYICLSQVFDNHIWVSLQKKYIFNYKEYQKILISDLFSLSLLPPSSNYVNQKNVHQYNYFGNYVSILQQYHNNPHWQFIFLSFFFIVARSLCILSIAPPLSSFYPDYLTILRCYVVRLGLERIWFQCHWKRRWINHVLLYPSPPVSHVICDLFPVLMF